MTNVFWPEIDDLWSAKKACIQAASVAFLVAIITGVVAVMHLKGVTLLEGVNSGGFIDAAVFLVLGFFIYRCSRIASLAALVLYVYGQILIAQQMHKAPVSGIFFSFLLISGIRGSFAFHLLKSGLGAENVRAALKEQRESTEPRPSLVKRIIAWVVLLALIAGGYFWYRTASHRPAGRLIVRSARQTSVPSSSGENSRGHNNIPETAKPARDLSSLPEKRVFRLKNGGSVTGRVILDDPVYYTVEVSGGQQKIIIKEDLESAGN